MSVKILGGLAKGFSLKVPSGNHVRPTSVLLKRRIFDSFQSLEGTLFVDSCSGTGAIGLEAWSRGAEEVYLLEKNRKVYKNLEQNVKKLSETYSREFSLRPVRPCLVGVDKWMETFQGLYLEKKEDLDFIFFFDPPYEETKLYEKIILNRLANTSWYKGLIWIESDVKKGLKQNYWNDKNLEIKKVFSQGDSYILIAKVREK